MGFLLHLIVAFWIAMNLAPRESVSLAGVGLVLAAYYAAGRAMASALARAVLAEEASASVTLARFRRGLSVHRLLALPAFAWVLWAGGWAELRDRALRDAGSLAGVAVALAPYLLLLILSRASTHPAERLLGLQRHSLLRSFGFTTRLGALGVLPVILLVGGWSAASALAGAGVPPFALASDLAARYDFVSGAFLFGGLALVFVLFPVIAMGVLGARPLPPGPLRSRLEAYARRVGLRYRDLYLWNTEGSLPNAAVLGVGARFRCVVFTDALLDQLDDEEVEAVFGHEAGHALHHHLPLFFLFAVGYALSLYFLSWVLPVEWRVVVERDPWLAALFTLAGLLLFFLVIFGFVSRRLEQQADVHGLLTVGLPEGVVPGEVLADPGRHPLLRAVAAGEAEPRDHPFVRSLEGLAASMGGVREITGWRHFSLADRIDFLDRFVRDPGVRGTYRRRLRALLGVMGALLLAFAAGSAAALPVQLEGPDPAAAFTKAEEALARGRPEVARGWLEDGLRGSAARGVVLGPASFPSWTPRDRPVDRLAILHLAQTASDPQVPLGNRVRYREAEALLRSLAGRPEEAVATARAAVEMAGSGPVRDDAGGGPPRPLLRALRAEALLVLGDLLRDASRPEAARTAWRDAAREAEEAGAEREALREAVKRRL